MVELILVGNGVKLTALHLPEGGHVWATGVDVAQTIAFPLPGAVLPAKLGSTQETDKLFVSLEATIFPLTSLGIWSCLVLAKPCPALPSKLTFYRNSSNFIHFLTVVVAQDHSVPGL